MMGKNFSMANKGQRNKSDFYQTPYSLTRELLNHELFDFNLSVLEPACGQDAIVKVLNERFNINCVVKGDIQKGVDFLKFDGITFPYLITNPPFSLAYEFIVKAKEVTEDKIAMVLPLNYLHGQKRYETLWKDKEFPLKKVYVFSRYPMLTDKVREDGLFNTGMMVYMWAVWERSYTGLPYIDWIDINKYIIKKKK